LALLDLIQEKKLFIPYLVICEDSEVEEVKTYIKNDPLVNIVSSPQKNQDIFLMAIQRILKVRDNAIAKQLDYVKVSLSHLIVSKILKTDAYVKINEKKYVKIFSKDNLFVVEEIAKYGDKYNDFLYVKKSDFVGLSQEFIHKMEMFEKKGELDSTLKIGLSLKSYKLAKELIDGIGFNKEAVSLANKSIDSVAEILKEYPRLSTLLSKLFSKNNYLSKHSMAISFVVISLARYEEWNSDTTRTSLCMAAFFHDIFVENDEMAKIDVINPCKNGELLELAFDDYVKHPKKAAKLLDQLDGNFSVAQNIVLHHHERPDGTGFPNKLTYKKIPPISAVFILSEYFINYIFEHGFSIKHREEAIQQMKINFTEDLYRQFIDNFKHVFPVKELKKNAS